MKLSCKCFLRTNMCDVTKKSPNSIYFHLLIFLQQTYTLLILYKCVYLAHKSQSHSIFCPLLILIYIEYLNGILNTHLFFFSMGSSTNDKINENKRKKTLDK